MDTILNPIYQVISWILLRWHELWNLALPDHRILDSNFDWILAIIFLVITIRVVLFPLFVKQIKSQRAMQAIQPKVKALQEKHKGDRETLQKELMELYRTEKANPLMGCLPLLLQAPVLFGLFTVLRRLDPNKDGSQLTGYGWTLEQFESASHAKLFGAPIAAQWGSSAEWLDGSATVLNVKVVAGVLIAIMVATTYYTSRQMILKTGWSEDNNQRMIQKLMLYGIPASLLISGGIFPIGVVIYWVTSNLFSMGQQFWVLKKFPPPPSATKTGSGKTGTGKVGAKTGTGKAAGAKATGTRSAKAGTKTTAAKAGVKEKAKNGKTPTGEAAAAVDGKALAPRPGAKPVHPKKGAAKPRKTR